MIDPQCPHIKSSPPVPDILLSVRRIERFNVVTGPTAIMSIVAISSPTYGSLGEIDSPKTTGLSTRLRRMSHFCLGRHVVRDGATPKWRPTRVANAQSSGSLVQINLYENSPYRHPANRICISEGEIG